MRNLYYALACTNRSFIKCLKPNFVGLAIIITAICYTPYFAAAQTNPDKERQLQLERAALASSVNNGSNANAVAIEMARESRKQQMTVSERLAMNPRVTNRNSLTDATQLINGTLTLAEPTFNRPLTFAQGGSCALSGVGTATHYRTHTFTLSTPSNVVISLDPADGASIAPGSADTFLELINGGVFNPASPCTNAIAADDDGGAGFLSRIATTTPLAAGTYTIVVTSFDNTPSDFPWTYTVAVLTPGCEENFDGVVAPALPAGWSTTASGIGIPWTTSTTSPISAPNNAFGPETSNVGLTELTSSSFPIVSTTAQLTFRNRFNLESAFDGMVLEMSIDGGAFQDVLAAGATFATGGYTGTLNTGFANPLPGRAAWTGLSGGTTASPTYITTTLNLPASASGHNVRFRWRVGSDNSVVAAGANGARIDNIAVNGSDCVAPGCAGTPVAGTITGQATACGGNSVTLTLAGQSSGPGISIQWRSSATPGGPYTNITGAFGTSYTFNATTTLYYIATITCNNGGASANTPEKSLLVGTPVHSAVSAVVTTVCTPGAATVTGTVSGGSLVGGTTLGTSGTINLAIPDNNATGVSNTIVLPASSITNAADLKIRINASHTWVGDLRFTLTSPCGTTFLFDRPGVPVSGVGNSNNLGTSNVSPNPPPAVYTFDLGAATIIPETALGSGFIPGGSYRPSDAAGAAHNWAGLAFPCAVAGNWVLNVSDNAGLDLGTLVDWQILGPPVYTHTLTGPGTITQNAPTGAGNSTANFTITNLPAGLHTFTLTSTDAIGCSVVSAVTALIKQTPIITIVPAAPVICNGAIQQLTASVVPPINQTFSQPATTVVPAGAPTTTAGIAGPYPSTIAVSGLPATGITVKSVSLNNVNHTFPDDMDVVLVSPTGVAVVLMSDAGGGTDIVGLNYTFDDAAAAMADGALNPQGTYRPTNFGATDNYPAPGPGSLTQAAPLLSSFTGNPNGTWRLYIVDGFTGDAGFVGNWNIVFNIPPTVVFSPTTNLFTDAAATIPYTGTPINTVYTRANTTTTYTATSTVDGCTNAATVIVTVNQLPAITSQPSPATQTVCPGNNITYTVTASGTGPLTYQWRKNGVNLVNDGQTFGVTSSTLSLFNVNATHSGSYTCVVTGICPPPATSNAAVLNVATTPVIGTQPANATVCVGGTTTFSVASSGTPTPNIFQWQVSTDNGANFSNLANTASTASPYYNNVFSATLTIGNVPASLNGYRYRVIVRNSCGQSVTSNGNATLTVNGLTAVTIGALPAKICVSDTLVALSATPTGGSWSGIGVSGFNFVPSATAVGTYTLTYSYTNASGCVSTATTSARVEDCPERVRLLRDDAVILFPNPNNGRFNIRINSTLYNYMGMRVYTTAGHLVKIQDFRGLVYGRVIPIDISNLPGGNYMVKFYYDDGVRTSEKTFQVVIGR